MNVPNIEKTSPVEVGASLNDLQAIEQAVDELNAQIVKMDDTIKQQKFTIEELEETKKKLTYLLADMEQRYLSSKNKAISELKFCVTREIEEQYARKFYVLEQDNKELDSENDIIGSERDALQSRVIELETICHEQTFTIAELRAKIPLLPGHVGFKSAVDSLKTKLGLDGVGSEGVRE